VTYYIVAYYAVKALARAPAQVERKLWLWPAEENHLFACDTVLALPEIPCFACSATNRGQVISSFGHSMSSTLAGTG
jgi:hypothetical protein